MNVYTIQYSLIRIFNPFSEDYVCKQTTGFMMYPKQQAIAFPTYWLQVVIATREDQIKKGKVVPVTRRGDP
jgi:hypothetical protein